MAGTFNTGGNLMALPILPTISIMLSIGRFFWRPKPKPTEVVQMDGVKGFLQSKTIWGVVVMVTAQILKRNGVEVDEAGLLNDIVSIVGTILAVYGRVTAKTVITVSK